MSAEIQALLHQAGGGGAYIDLADGGTFILDGCFTLAEIAAMGDVAREAMRQQALSAADDEVIR
jgi:hypothetical protein